MNKKLVTSIIVSRIVFAVAAIVGSGVVAGGIAWIASLITNDVEIIVDSCLVGVWMMLVLFSVFRARYVYNKRMLGVGKDSTKEAVNLKRRLAKWYTGSVIFSSLIFGYLFFELHYKIINDLNGVSTPASATHDIVMIFIRASVVAAVVAYFVTKKLKQRKARIS